MDECTWVCLNGKHDRTQVIIQQSQMLEMTTPLMLCAAQKTALLARKTMQETSPMVLRKCCKINPKLLDQNPQKPKGFGLNPTSQNRPPRGPTPSKTTQEYDCKDTNKILLQGSEK